MALTSDRAAKPESRHLDTAVPEPLGGAPLDGQSGIPVDEDTRDYYDRHRLRLFRVGESWMFGSGN